VLMAILEKRCISTAVLKPIPQKKRISTAVLMAILSIIVA